MDRQQLENPAAEPVENMIELRRELAEGSRRGDDGIIRRVQRGDRIGQRGGNRFFAVFPELTDEG
ncbi:hypothetical protein SDC9_146588 [bioreactor metagenome]|uniref:Uncharacterized protein n=1 Tax=bioreactor metagenome TaxID=1076179 RepID=A0A645EBP3_9ZZZZ